MNTSWLFVVLPVFDSAALLQGPSLLTQLPQSQANLLPSQQSISLTTQVPTAGLLSSCQSVLPMCGLCAVPSLSLIHSVCVTGVCVLLEEVPLGIGELREQRDRGPLWSPFHRTTFLIWLTKRHFHRHFQSFYVKAVFPSFVPSGCMVCIFLPVIFPPCVILRWETQFFTRYHNIDNVVLLNYSVHMRSSW